MEHFRIPDKLYGRDREIGTLLDSLRRVGRGCGEVLLVPGNSGAGKTALVQTLGMPVREKNGFFVQGKFDQYQQNIPYSAFRQALAALCRELLSEDDLLRERWRVDISKAVGDRGGLLAGLVPELQSLLGTFSLLADASPQEARLRFFGVFRDFLEVVCRPEHPLVLFLDDCQWADAASLELLRQMQVGISLRYLLVIVSYRDDEVGSAHPLVSTIDDLRSHDVPIVVLRVENLGVADLHTLVADALEPAAENVAGLSSIIHGATQGNPFFVRSVLDFLCESNLVRFDEGRGHWRWRMATVGEAGLPGNVVELFGLKICRLDPKTRRLLALAACLGSHFDVESLRVISGRSYDECLATLLSDQVGGMLLPLEDGGLIGEARSVPEVWRFSHDRVQQAAYALIEPSELERVRLEIGRHLLAYLTPEQLADRLFEVVGHLNQGQRLLGAISEQTRLVELNMTAARKAYDGTAYRSALQFFRAASRILETPGFAEHLWRDCHELAMPFFKEWARCEFLEGDRGVAEDCTQQAVVHARTAMERAEALIIFIVQYTMLAKYPEAIVVGRQALAALGISLPEEDYEEARDEEIAQVRKQLEGRSVASLFDLPVMSHPEMLMASRLLITMGPPCYRSHQRLWSVIVAKVVNLTLRYGNIAQVGYSHTAFGGLLGWVDNDYATARAFGELATRLMTEKFRTPSDQSVFYLMRGSSISHWFKHLKYGSQDYAEAYDVGLRSSNLQYAAYAFGHDMYCRFYQGVMLPDLLHESRRSLEFSRTRTNQWAIDLIEGGLNIFGVLTGERRAPDGHGGWSDHGYALRVEARHNSQVACIYKILEAFSCLVLGHHDRALALSDEAEPLIFTVGTQGLLPWAEHLFARLLIITALYPTVDAERQSAWRDELGRIMDRLRVWSETCPENFEHKYRLAAAELARLEGRPVEAMGLYDQAVDAAQVGGFHQWEAIANERAYRFWSERGDARLAQVYWQQAYACYDRWGAGAKVQSMEAEYRASIAGTLLVVGKFGTSAEAFERAQSSDVLLDKQVGQLRKYADEMHQARLRPGSEALADDLGRAVERLRTETSERKRMAEALQSANERLRESYTELEMQNHELRRTEEQLDVARARYFDLYDLAPAGYVTVGGKGLIQEGNLTAATMLGTVRSLLVKRPIHRFIAQMDQDIYYRHRKLLLEERSTPGQGVAAHAGEVGRPHKCELRMVKNDGTVFWVSLDMTVASGPDSGSDDADAIRIVLSDIGARKQVEESLTQERLRLANIIDGTHLGTWEWNVQTGETSFNDRWAEIIGYTLEELSPVSIETWTRFTHPDDLNVSGEQLEKHFRGDIDYYDCQARMKHKDGTWVWVIDRGKVTTWTEDGKPLLMQGTHTDITHQKRLEEVQAFLAQHAAGIVEESFSASLVRYLAESLRQDFVSVDRIQDDGSTARSVAVWCDGHFEDDLTYDLKGSHGGELLGRTSCCFPADVRRSFPHDRVLRDLRAESYVGVTLYGRRGRAIGLLRVIGRRPLGNSQLVEAALGLVAARAAGELERLDVEAEKALLREQLVQAQKMEAIGRLAGGVAHDFNNMSMAIMGYAELCKDKIAPQHPIREWLDGITLAAERSAETTRQLLAFARKQVVVPKVVDVNAAVAVMLKLLVRLIGEDVKLVWQPGADLGPVMIDPSQLDQILANLCVNARDAISGVGEIVLKTGAVLIDESVHAERRDEVTPGKYVVLTVSDDGVGMDPETLALIFEPFFTTKDVGSGTGLGLATVYGIIKQNHGFIFADSCPGKGTTFTIYLPQVAQEAVATTSTGTEPKEAAPGGCGETVLLTEDEGSLRRTCRLFLERLGYKVLVAETADEALEIAERYPGDIHMLLTDVVMPGMDGTQLARLISSTRPGLRVLLMSGYGADAVAERGMLEQGMAFIAKPFTRDELAREVRQLLEGA